MPKKQCMSGVVSRKRLVSSPRRSPMRRSVSRRSPILRTSIRRSPVRRISINRFPVRRSVSRRFPARRSLSPRYGGWSSKEANHRALVASMEKLRARKK